jgi:selenocysteine lyase/cysteine desulfurase
MDFPLEYARGNFPALERSDTVYFDHVRSPLSLRIVEASREAGKPDDAPEELLAETRESLAFFLNSNDAWAGEEILVAADAAELERRTCEAIARDFEPGAEIILSELDDESSLEPWLALQERDLVVKFWPMTRPQGGLSPARLENLLTERTRLVVVPKVSPALGTVVELLPAALKVRDHSSASLLIHWTPFIAHGAIDVRFLRADFVLASTRPLFGSRLSFLWGKKERMSMLRSETPELFEGNEPSPEDVAALGATLRYVEEIGLLSQEMQVQPSEDYGRRRHMRRGMQAIRHYERSLTSLALRRLAAVRGARVYGIGHADEAAHRIPNLTFTIEAMSPEETANALGKHGIRVFAGNQGCPRTMKALGVPEQEGAVSATLAHYNEEREVERFSEALQEIVHAS